MPDLTLYCVRQGRDDLFVQLCPVNGDVVFQTTQDEVVSVVCLSHTDARTLAHFLLMQLPPENANEH